jgi:predicted esterase
MHAPPPCLACLLRVLTHRSHDRHRPPQTPCWFAPRVVERDASSPTGFRARAGATEAFDAVAKQQLSCQTRRIHAVLDREAAILDRDASRVVLGGTSQGGSVALHAAMEYHSPLAALICLRTMVIERFTTIRGGPAAPTPVFVFAGGRDAVCNLEAQRASFDRMKAEGYAVDWHVEPDLGHAGECLNEQRYVQP